MAALVQPACRVTTLLVIRRTLTFEIAVSILYPFPRPEIFLPALLCILPFNIAAFYCVNEDISDQCRVRVSSSPVQMQLLLKSNLSKCVTIPLNTEITSST